VDEEGLHPATLEEMGHMCRSGRIPALVWTPESGGGIPPEEVPALLQAIRDRLVGGAKLPAMIAGAVVAWLIMQGINAGEVYFGAPWMVYAAFGLVWIGLRVREWRQGSALTAEGYREMKRQAQEAAVVRRAPVVYLRAVAATVAVGAAAQILAMKLGDLSGGIDAASMDPARIAAGEGWRLLTCGYLHAGVMHFIFNFMALLSLGRETEVLAHRAFVPLVFLVAVVAGSLASYALPPDVTSVGASGGIMGLIGFLGVLAYRRRESVPAGFLNMIILNIAVIGGIGLVGFRFVDNAAHLGGLVAGAVLGVLLIPATSARPAWTPSPVVQTAGTGALGLLVLGCVWTVLRVLAPVL
jgi:membrane associated rhomboid family serine protease